jgi:hypothetical protein
MRQDSLQPYNPDTNLADNSNPPGQPATGAVAATTRWIVAWESATRWTLIVAVDPGAETQGLTE